MKARERSEENFADDPQGNHDGRFRNPSGHLIKPQLLHTQKSAHDSQIDVEHYGGQHVHGDDASSVTQDRFEKIARNAPCWPPGNRNPKDDGPEKQRSELSPNQTPGSESEERQNDSNADLSRRQAQLGDRPRAKAKIFLRQRVVGVAEKLD